MNSIHFRIKHFVGAVSYDCREFVSRNRDLLDRNLSQAMFECQHPLLKVLFPEGKFHRDIYVDKLLNIDTLQILFITNIATWYF